jgi:hypothetical protein
VEIDLASVSNMTIVKVIDDEDELGVLIRKKTAGGQLG